MNRVNKSDTKAGEYIKYISALLLFGSNGIVASKINMSSYEIVFLRTMIGSIFLILLFCLGKRKVTFTKHKRDFMYIVLSGIAMGASWIFLYEAYALIGVSLASLAYYCGPVIVMILSPFLFKERLTGEKIIGFLIVLGGIFLINGKLSGGALNRYGILCGLMSAVMYSLMVMFNKKSKNIKGLENSVIQLFVSFLTAAVFVGFKTGYSIAISGDDVIWIIILGLVNTGIGCWFYFSSIGNIPVQTVAICGYLEPLSAVILALIVLGETMTIPQIIGAIMIISGAVFSECFKFGKNIISNN